MRPKALQSVVAASLLVGIGLLLVACGVPQGEVPMPPGESPFAYLLAWLQRYGWLGLLAGLALLLIYTFTNKGFEWIADRLFRRAVKVHDEWKAEQQREKERDAALAAYLEHILSHYSTLNLRGIRSSQPMSLSLEDMYISLTTVDRPAGSSRREGEEESRLPVRSRPAVVPLNELMPRHMRLVILGDPGAGKTTFLSYLALTYARHLDGRWPNVMRERLGYTEELLPILLPLRDFARHIRVRCERDVVEPGPALLLEFINQHFAQWNLNLPATFFSDPLQAGRCILLLDGLDEVADYEERVFVREVIEAFVARYPKNRYVLTSRSGGYRDAARLAHGFYECRIRDFDGEDVKRFVTAWNLAVEAAQAGMLNLAVRHKAERQATDLLNAIERNPRIRALATNPLMLTVIALVHRYRATLPQRRVELYEECTELLLGHWDMGKEGEEAKWLAEYAGIEIPLDASEKRSLLEPVARWYHEQRVTEAEQWQVERLLTERMAQVTLPAGSAVQSQASARAKGFLNFLKERSGLFQEWQVGHYAFTHLTFQEYLAARAIASEDDYINQILAHVGDSWWKETILLTAAHLSLTSRSRASQLVRAILVSAAGRKTDWWQIVTLAGECLIDIGRYRVDAKLWQDVVNGLVWLVERQSVPLHDRFRAATVLGELGDPRLGNVVVVPGGPFLFSGGEQPKLLFVERFEIDRLPVTNAQFAAFMESGGYRTREYWSDEGWNFIQREGIDRPRFWDDPLWNRPNYPVVGVSWYEAEAYARWAGGALPTEAQWEKAAGWDPQRETARKWPWGDELLSERANTSDLNLDSTSPVGLFPYGASPYGALDMAGNVWEWCVDRYWNQDDQATTSHSSTSQARVLRGGSWRDDINLAKVSSRDRAHPTAREPDIGFRLVWSE